MNQETIEKYILGELKGKVLKDFEDKMLQNRDLKYEVEKQQRILEEMVDNGAEKYIKLKNRLEGIHQEMNIVEQVPTIQNSKYKIRKISGWILAGAAMFLLLFLAKAFLLKPSYTPQELFAEYASHQNISLIEMGEQDNVMLQAQEFYNQKEYDKALPYFDQLLNKNEAQFDLQLYRGICYLRNNQYDKALQDFNFVSNSKSIYTQQAYWYEALCKLKQNKIEECKDSLNKLISKYNNFQPALKLQEQLDKL